MKNNSFNRWKPHKNWKAANKKETYDPIQMMLDAWRTCLKWEIFLFIDFFHCGQYTNSGHVNTLWKHLTADKLCLTKSGRTDVENAYTWETNHRNCYWNCYWIKFLDKNGFWNDFIECFLFLEIIWLVLLQIYRLIVKKEVANNHWFWQAK
jgi:hypothetical protein